jgi:succinate dehydrogenase / fumarate reductase membrane anchor subunit
LAKEKKKVTMQILTFLRKKHASLHWYAQRFTAALLLPMLLWVIFSGAVYASATPDIATLLHKVVQTNPYLLLFINVVLFWHIRTGVESILDDYVHHEKTKFFSYLTVRLLTLQLMKYFYLFTLAFM